MARRVSETPYFVAALQVWLGVVAAALLVLLLPAGREGRFVRPFGGEVYEYVLAEHELAGGARFRLLGLHGDGTFGPGPARGAAVVVRDSREQLLALTPTLGRGPDLFADCPRVSDCRLLVVQGSLRADAAWRLDPTVIQRPAVQWNPGVVYVHVGDQIVTRPQQDWRLGALLGADERRWGFAPAEPPPVTWSLAAPRRLAQGALALAFLAVIPMLAWAAFAGAARGWSSVAQAALLLPALLVLVLVLFNWRLVTVLLWLGGPQPPPVGVLVTLVAGILLVVWRGRTLAGRGAVSPPARGA